MSTAPAVFLGIQPGFRHLPAIELFNLTAAVGGLPVGATVSRQTLERYGFRLPPRESIRGLDPSRAISASPSWRGAA